jgi:hypothetical protein
MTSAEARRLDLYNGLTEFLGEDRANTLMAYLPSQHSTDLATKADLDALKTAVTVRFDTVDQRFDRMDQRFETMDQRFEAITHRLDRMVFALVAGLVAIIATLVAQSFI